MHHLWEQFTNRYMLAFDRVNDDALQLLIDEMIRNKDNFTFQYPEFTRNELYYHDENGEMRIREQTANYDSRKPITGMKYGEFLLKLTQRTKLKPAQLHKSLLNALKDTYIG